MINKVDIDSLAAEYETYDFIKDDPVQFCNNYKDKNDIETAGFIASLFAYGNRKVFIRKLYELFDIMQNKPFDFIKNGDFKLLKNFNYRFIKDNDITEILLIMRTLYEKDGSLEELFKYGYKQGVEKIFKTVVDYFYSRVKNPVGQGFYHAIPNPENGGAMKRMCMYLRWMVRKGPVDLDLWHFMKPCELLIPLDVHVARISREMGLMTSKVNNFKAVLELTENLKKFDAHDPIKYDFAMFGYGVNQNRIKIKSDTQSLISRLN